MASVGLSQMVTIKEIEADAEELPKIIQLLATRGKMKNFRIRIVDDSIGLERIFSIEVIDHMAEDPATPHLNPITLLRNAGLLD